MYVSAAGSKMHKDEKQTREEVKMTGQRLPPKLVAGLGLWAWGQKPQAGQAQQQWLHCLVAGWGGEDMVKAVSLVTWFQLV
jgi:hypothetical protein